MRDFYKMTLSVKIFNCRFSKPLPLSPKNSRLLNCPLQQKDGSWNEITCWTPQMSICELAKTCQNLALIGNGFCNDETNNADCEFDGGDCSP